MITVDIKKQLHAGAERIALELAVSIPGGELLALFGPSGSGKTSVLRMIAGLMRPDNGVIEVDGVTWFDSRRGVNVPPQRRDIAIVFQEYALFPNMSVRENVTYALRDRSATERVQEVLRMMELSAMAGVKPYMLSGGQRQRVALARSLVREARVLLLDEPTSALDAELQSRVHNYLESVQRRTGAISLLVTHDMLEVARLASRALVLENGVVKSSGAPRDVLPLGVLENLLNTLRDKERRSI